jgi:hypothetical protein
VQFSEASCYLILLSLNFLLSMIFSDTRLLILVLNNLAYSDFLTLHVPNFMSIFLCLGLSKETMKTQSCLQHFVTCWSSTLRCCWRFNKPSSSSTIHCGLSTTAYLAYLNLLSTSISGGLQETHLQTRESLKCYTMLTSFLRRQNSTD